MTKTVCSQLQSEVSIWFPCGVRFLILMKQQANFYLDYIHMIKCVIILCYFFNHSKYSSLVVILYLGFYRSYNRFKLFTRATWSKFVFRSFTMFSFILQIVRTRYFTTLCRRFCTKCGFDWVKISLTSLRDYICKSCSFMMLITRQGFNFLNPLKFIWLKSH